jgi:uncharacterized protein YutE (UPF0331/DUF86 family)
MQNYLKPRIDNVIDILKKDFDMIAKKKKDNEWKRDHYRYAFTLAAQRMYDLLNSNLTGEEMYPVSPSTKKELKALRSKIDEMLIK